MRMRIIIALLLLIAVGCADKKDPSEITVIPAPKSPAIINGAEPAASPEPEGKTQSKIKLNFEGMHYPVSTPPEKAKAPQPRMISIPLPIEDRVQNKFNSLSETILIVPNGVPSTVIIDDPAAVAPSNWRIDETPAPIEIDTPSIFPQFIDIVVEDTPPPRQLERTATIIQVISPDPEPANLPETVNGILPLGRQ